MKVRPSLSWRVVKLRNLNASFGFREISCRPGVLRVIGEAVSAELVRVEPPSRERVQRLDRMVANANVDEVLADQCSDARDVRIVGLLVQHRTAVARCAARSVGSGGHGG